jgi:type II restriction/modification system DNA methylase subunit YeeA
MGGRHRPEYAPWPEATVVVGNPPFLGGKKLRNVLGDDYVEALFRVYKDRVPREADLVSYWFEKARCQIEKGRLDRAGLLATNSIRGGASRRVLDRVRASGQIFMAWGDEPWIVEGAAVRISLIGFDGGGETNRTLDGKPVSVIHSDLTGAVTRSAAVDLTKARRLAENLGIAFMGDTKGGPFDIPGKLARQWLALPLNPNGRSNSDVVRPWANSIDVTRRPRDMWIIDFGLNMRENQASLYEAPFEYILDCVRPLRENNRRRAYREKWWIHVEPRPAMRNALSGLPRFIVTPTVAKHRLFTWCPREVLPDHQLIVIARDEDYFFGVLHSRFHEKWALRLGTSLEDRPRYTPTTTFETYPFPRATVDQRRAIEEAATRLDGLRQTWLQAEGASPGELKRRTLTNLYNEWPTWLVKVHAELDAAVASAYGWPAVITDSKALADLLKLNLEREAA